MGVRFGKVKSAERLNDGAEGGAGGGGGEEK